MTVDQILKAAELYIQAGDKFAAKKVLSLLPVPGDKPAPVTT